MPTEPLVLENAAGRMAAVGEEEKFVKNKEKPTKNEFDNFGGMGFPPTVDPLSLTQMLEKDAGERPPSTSYRVPFKNLFLKSAVGRANTFEKGEKGNLSWCSGHGGRGPDHGGSRKF